MIRMEVRKEDAVYGERVEARAEHAAEGARTEVEDEHLPAGAHHDAALAPLEAWDYGAGSDDGDLYVFLPSVVTACQLVSTLRPLASACRHFSLSGPFSGWLFFGVPAAVLA